MVQRIKELFRHRQLIGALVARELKARYRGTALGFFWSFFNPLLLMAVYSLVFGFIMQPRFPGMESNRLYYALFLFVGILPWTWFSSSVLECSRVLNIHGELIKKIQFPVESLPIMVVTTNMVHFSLGLPILVLFFILFGKGLTLWVLALPLIMLVQFIFTLGLCFFISSLTVHFRDLQDILANLLTLWFFCTPIIYPFAADSIQRIRPLKIVLMLNPMTHIIEAYQYAFFFGSLPHYKKLAVTVLFGVLFLALGYMIFDKLRDTFVEEV